MSDLFNKIITDYVNRKSPDKENNKIFVEMLKKDISDEIVNENIDIIQQKQAENQARLDKENATKKINEKLEESKDVVMVAVIIGFFVGFIVNQVTEVTSFFKGNGFEWKSTLFCICVALVAIYISYQKLFISKMYACLGISPSLNDSGENKK